MGSTPSDRDLIIIGSPTGRRKPTPAPAEKRMKLAYISGPYRSQGGINGIYDNVQHARASALKLWKKGYAVLCPHMNTQFLDGALPDEVWLGGDLEMLHRCDLVLMVDGWKDSAGSLAEKALAEKLGLPVFTHAHSVPDLRGVTV